MNLKSRILVLKQKVKGKEGVNVIYVNEGETEEQALKRFTKDRNFKHNAKNVYIHFV